ncbi:ATP-dependent DNA/RNA helicase DHX36-like [Anneissia japonica]|uniref:ATP-dependent DNA/RNA helicase DHX36-like n=1 Tax=Anneissia japonica TaxID=1529436 RepID=UPI001425850C|nr:ATP-dependent DNA/RNA helicase DHX36-like [Anneissia japonica]XP_033112397.1 ATP-dependent DNA/RNA helicase DHX36-like [Anneissia japonica]XP_033112398.1 ATP-dependent DNA/RNA helicase DHX36-like [Anneissia japonica]XP_033112399.1 ATP-dependent DNA/RNA helicase DHX36-like [Anneissia japonica]
MLNLLTSVRNFIPTISGTLRVTSCMAEQGYHRGRDRRGGRGRGNRGFGGHRHYEVDPEAERTRDGGEWQRRGRGGGGRGGRGGRGGPPPGLKGREIGMWYAQRAKAKKHKQAPTVMMQNSHINRIDRLLEDVKCEETSEADLSELNYDTGNSENREKWKFYSETLRDKPKLNEKFLEELEKKKDNERYKRMQEFRQKLPSYKLQKEILDAINSSQVVVLSGETGCGKTTQVSQFILDDYIRKGQGSLCRIVCTQPRRISAISVANRVAAERAEACGHGNSCGYQIRLEAEFPRLQGCIVYCTTGILLKWMEFDSNLSSTSHVILDEIHERDVLSDFLLMMLRDVLPKRPNLKLILMSATLNAAKFSEYFGDSPMLNIPGFTFPVQEYFIEDVLQLTRYHPPPKTKRFEPKWVKFAKGRKFREEEMRKEQEFQELFAGYIEKQSKLYNEETVESLVNMDHDVIDYDLMLQTILYIIREKDDGAILIFLPGWDQISRLNDKLMSQAMFKSRDYLIIPLHSMMPTVNQQQVFDRPPKGVRKIIIATNIAETSITIDDVVFVIDAGKVKEKNFDVKNNISTLQPEWTSLAAAKQRRGRAGRVQPGECYHLYSTLRHSMMPDYQLPEMQRTPLEEVCLQIKTLKLGLVRNFLDKAMDKPDEKAITLALTALKQMNAFDENEDLTPLGYHLARLPVEPKIGRLILFGAMFCCLDPILTIAACLSFKDPFFTPLGKEKEADVQKWKLSCGSKSDHLMMVYAFRKWEMARATGAQAERAFCWDNFMSLGTTKMLDNMKTQFCELLCNIGFVMDKNCKQDEANIHSDNDQLIKAVLCAGLYPNVSQVSARMLKKGPRVKCYTKQDGKVDIHPKSVNAKETSFPSNYLLYHLKLKSSGVYLHDTTMVEPYPLLFFGGDLHVGVDEDGQEIISVDDQVTFRSQERIAALVKDLRKELDKLLEAKITRPGLTNWSKRSKEGKIMSAIVELLTMYGPRQENDGRDEDYDDF